MKTRITFPWTLELGEMKSVPAKIFADVGHDSVTILGVEACLQVKTFDDIDPSFDVFHCLKLSTLAAMQEAIRSSRLAGVRDHVEDWDDGPHGAA